jgi:N-acetylglucosaminyl-diphospho-decaprenol L-rhamnosyltransferase
MQSTQNPVLSVVIVSYNVRDFLTECLRSVEKFITVPHEIIVVDNASSDGTCEAVKHDFPQVNLIESKINLGFSAGNNLAFSKVRGGFILMLNPDAALIDYEIMKAVYYLQQHADKPILVGPCILNPDKTYQTSAWKFPKLRQLFLESIFLNKLIDLTAYTELESAKNETEVDFVSGAAILMQIETLQTLKGLDENLFWMDDTDFCYRNRINGGKSIYFSEWKIIHHIGKSSERNLPVVISNQLISKLKFFKKHSLGFKYTAGIFIVLLHIKMRLILLTIGSVFFASSRKKLAAYWFSFKKLFRYIFQKDGSLL